MVVGPVASATRGRGDDLRPAGDPVQKESTATAPAVKRRTGSASRTGRSVPILLRSAGIAPHTGGPPAAGTAPDGGGPPGAGAALAAASGCARGRTVSDTRMPRIGDRLSMAAAIGLERGPPPGPTTLGAPARARAVGAEPGSGATGHVKPSVAPCRPEAPRNPPPGAPAATDRDATARAVMSRGG